MFHNGYEIPLPSSHNLACYCHLQYELGNKDKKTLNHAKSFPKYYERMRDFVQGRSKCSPTDSKEAVSRACCIHDYLEQLILNIQHILFEYRKDLTSIIHDVLKFEIEPNPLVEYFYDRKDSVIPFLLNAYVCLCFFAFWSFWGNLFFGVFRYKSKEFFIVSSSLLKGFIKNHVRKIEFMCLEIA
jgi:hypothetical protein